MWCKHTQFEIDNRVPMILRVPGEKSAGAKTEALVEFVDIYPSLCELAGIELPAHLQGLSFVPVVDNPDMKWKEGAISYWPSVGRTDPSKVIMGYTVQTLRYRYTEWIKESSGELLARDLFDHQTDPDENESIANNPANKALINELSALLDRGKGWRQIGEKVSQ